MEIWWNVGYRLCYVEVLKKINHALLHDSIIHEKYFFLNKQTDKLQPDMGFIMEPVEQEVMESEGQWEWCVSCYPTIHWECTNTLCQDFCAAISDHRDFQVLWIIGAFILLIFMVLQRRFFKMIRLMSDVCVTVTVLQLCTGWGHKGWLCWGPILRIVEELLLVSEVGGLLIQSFIYCSCLSSLLPPRQSRFRVREKASSKPFYQSLHVPTTHS